MLEGLKLKIVRLGENNITEKDLLVHDSGEPDPGIHYMLANMRYPDYPVAFGVIRSVEGNTYETDAEEQISRVRKTAKIKCVDDLLTSGLTWIVD